MKHAHDCASCPEARLPVDARQGRPRRAGALLIASLVAALVGTSIADRAFGAIDGATSPVLLSTLTDRAERDFLDDVIAADLGAVLSGSFEPRVTTVQVPRLDETRVVRAITQQLVERGFGVQRVAVDQGPNLLIHTRVAERRPDGLWVTARAAIGSVSVRRDYRLGHDRRVHTGSSLRIYGGPGTLPAASLSSALLQVDDPSHLDVEYIARHLEDGD